MKEAELWTVHTRRLPPLVVGHHMHIQNQTGPHPNKWDKTGVIIEVHQFDQYVVRVDGSGRITLRNLKFLRRYVSIQAPQPRCTTHDDFSQITKLPANPAASPTLWPTTCPLPLPQAHPSSNYPEPAVSTPLSPIAEPPPPKAIVEPHQTSANPPPTPVSPLASTPPTPKC